MRPTALLAILGAFALTGCVPYPGIHLINEFGTTIFVHVDRHEGTLGWQDKRVAIDPGKARKGLPSSFFNGSVFSLRAEGCDYRYERGAPIWVSSVAIPHRINLVVRRGSDGTPELTPTVSGYDREWRRRFEELVELRMRPVSRVCDAPTSPS